MKTLLLLLTMPLFAHGHIVDYGTWYQWQNVKDSTGLHVKLVERTPPIIIKDSIVYDTTYLVSPVSCPDCPEVIDRRNDFAAGAATALIFSILFFSTIIYQLKSKR